MRNFTDSLLFGTTEQLVERLQGLAALGLGYAITNFPESAYDTSGIELFEREVIPALAGGGRAARSKEMMLRLLCSAVSADSRCQPDSRARGDVSPDSRARGDVSPDSRAKSPGRLLRRPRRVRR